MEAQDASLHTSPAADACLNHRPSPTTATAGGEATSEKPGGQSPWPAGAWGFLPRTGHRHRCCRDAFSPGVGRRLPPCHDAVREAQPIDSSKGGVGACLRRRVPGGFELVSSAGGALSAFVRLALSDVGPSCVRGRAVLFGGFCAKAVRHKNGADFQRCSFGSYRKVGRCHGTVLRGLAAFPQSIFASTYTLAPLQPKEVGHYSRSTDERTPHTLLRTARRPTPQTPSNQRSW